MGEPVSVSSANDRLVSLDALRGFDMFWIMGADALGHAAAELARSPWSKAIADQLEHVDWEGFRFYDLIFPLFVFLAGLASALSTSRTVAKHGKDAALVRVVRRTVLLFLLGIFYYRGFEGWGDDIRVLGVLQRIALTSGVAGWMCIYFKPRSIAITCVSILVGYWILMRFVPVPGGVAGDLTIEKNLAHWVDEHWLPGRKWDGKWDPEGLLSTLPAIASALLGVLAGFRMKTTGFSIPRQAGEFALAGIVCLALGWIWGRLLPAPIGFPIIKKLWTSSYVLVAGGWSLMILGAFHYVVDGLGWQAWCRPFTWVGANALMVYMVSNLVDFTGLAKRFTGGNVSAALNQRTHGLGDMTIALTGLLLCILFARFLYRRQIFIRL